MSNRIIRFFPIAFLTAALSAHASDSGLPSASFVQAFVGLGVIVILLAATAWLARKMSGGRGFGHSGMRVLGGITLGPRERIVLLEVGEQCLVIGVIPGQIRTLYTLPRGELPPAAENPPANFAHWLKTRMEKNAPRGDSHA